MSRILVVAPHADDETLGVGGTMARRVAEGHEVYVAVMTGHGTEGPHPFLKPEVFETVRGELAKACEVMGVKDVLYEEIPAVTVADQPLYKLNQATQRVVAKVQPDELYVPFLYDLHKDHRELFHSLSVHWRPYLPLGQGIRKVYTYEVLSETHLNAAYLEPGFHPNVFVDISDHLETKIEALRCFESQLQEHPAPRSLEAIRALATWRGSQVGVAAAEAFVLVRSLD